MLLTRKGFLAAVAGAGAMVAVGAGASAALASEEAPLRPPGGQDEERLLGACIRCDRCRGACPQGCIAPATLADGLVSARTPKMNFRQGYCDFCEGEYRCTRACPLGVLGPFDEHADRIGIAVIDHGLCLAYDATPSCQKCVDACPYQAIVLNDQGRPVVEEARCNGCGLCEFICPSASFRTYGGSSLRGVNVWTSKEAAERGTREARGGKGGDGDDGQA